eukprot:1824018-Rhodomonas_salina.4
MDEGTQTHTDADTDTDLAERDFVLELAVGVRAPGGHEAVDLDLPLRVGREEAREDLLALLVERELLRVEEAVCVVEVVPRVLRFLLRDTQTARQTDGQQSGQK